MDVTTPGCDAAVTALAQDAGMGEIRRVFVLPAVAVLACASLSACYLGPDPVQYGALAVVDGKATAVVALCGRSTTYLTVYQDDNNPADNVSRSWTVDVSVPAPAHDVEVELLGEDRPGWQIMSHDDASPGATATWRQELKSFEPGHHYTLNASKGGPEGASAPMVSFTTDDLARIGKGQVLAPTGDKKSDVVPRESFVEEACAKKGPGAR
jgi:hypothetical protein